MKTGVCIVPLEVIISPALADVFPSLYKILNFICFFTDAKIVCSAWYLFINLIIHGNKDQKNIIYLRRYLGQI